MSSLSALARATLALAGFAIVLTVLIMAFVIIVALAMAQYRKHVECKGKE
jgi:hypothetical protein